MKVLLRFVAYLISGSFVGVSIVLLVALSGLTYSSMSEQAMRMPGLINVWPSVENQAVALNFEPNFLGALVVSLAVALIYALMRVLLASRPAESPSTL